ncbi:hypothetical protein WICPIJ_009968 [Wickerhamomyces pijperi]|uniref:Uncharacterized protein n=1 Tax=Wickerhamomyces pijperi TaxID=599730 RepID=A0A9P8PKH9_WICPI|nr:hypothetical protein WICPIJ_009968 [Wickerhamomyces pijperi]
MNFKVRTSMMKLYSLVGKMAKIQWSGMILSTTPQGNETIPQTKATAHIGPVCFTTLNETPPTNMISTWNPAMMAAMARNDNQLQRTLPQDHLPHRHRDQVGLSPLWLLIQDIVVRRIGGQREGSQSVHDQVHPKQLNSTKHRLALCGTDSGDESQQNSSDVDGDLELDELLDRSGDTSPPLDSLDDPFEIIAHQNNVRGLLGNFGA